MCGNPKQVSSMYFGVLISNSLSSLSGRIVQLACDTESMSPDQLPFVALAFCLHLRQYLANHLNSLPHVYTPSSTGIKMLKKIGCRSISDQQCAQVIASLSRTSVSNVFLISSDRHTSSYRVNKMLRKFAQTSTPPANIPCTELDFDCFSPVFRNHGIFWTRETSLLLRLPKQIALSTSLSAYLMERDRTSRHLMGSWSGTSGHLLAKVWECCSAPAMVVAASLRLFWDKLFHPGHIAFSGLDFQCPHCFTAFSLSHLFIQCSAPSVQIIRAEVREMLREKCSNLHPQSKLFQWIKFYESKLLLLSTESPRYWLASISGREQRDFTLLPFMLETSVEEAYSLRTSFLPILKLISRASSRMWYAWIGHVATPGCSPFYCTPVLRKLQLMVQFLEGPVSQAWRATASSLRKRKSSSDNEPPLKTRKISSFYLPIVPVPQDAPRGLVRSGRYVFGICCYYSWDCSTLFSLFHLP